MPENVNKSSDITSISDAKAALPFKWILDYSSRRHFHLVLEKVTQNSNSTGVLIESHVRMIIPSSMAEKASGDFIGMGATGTM